MVAVLLAYAAVTSRQTAKPAPIPLEPPPELLETEPLREDVAWTRQNPVEWGNFIQGVRLQNGSLSGELYANWSEVENPCCAERQSGFRSFQHSRFPEHNIFCLYGLNFEHILSGRVKDWEGGNFAPRKEPSTLRVYSETSAALFWPASNSFWGASSEMKFSLDREDHVDLEFRTALQAVPDADYLVYMWASYMKRVRAPEIQFWGFKDAAPTATGDHYDTPGWVSLDAKQKPGNPRIEQGIVPFLSARRLSIEPGLNNLNFSDNDWCAFMLPFFFGVVDGDGDSSTAQDGMAYIMMFDKAEQIRFIMWDFSGGTGNPVWDWQYVLRKPQANKTYGYRARLVYKPYAGLDDVVNEYVHWTKSLGQPLHRLKIEIAPPESATLFPADSAGRYGDNVQVYFGINPSPGWRFDHWEGDVTHKKRRFTQTQMNGDKTARAICLREK